MNTKTRCLTIAPFLLLCCIGTFQPSPLTDPFRCENGKISFNSVAALESIKAKSNKLQGILDPSNNTFAWSVDSRSFEGFNSPLQREHFNENYIEYTSHPKLSFTGKIIEKVDLQQNGNYAVRAKGKLTAHGIAQERIILCQLEVTGNKLHVQAEFTVPLADHDISIPRIVHQKIAEEVSVNVDAVMVAGKN